MTVPSFTRIYLLRHGEVVNPGNVFYGQTDVELTLQGREQSRLAALNLRGTGLSAVYSSDLSRCRFLADAISGYHSTSTVCTEMIREVDFGKWTGLSWREIEEMYPGAFERRMKDMEAYRPPGGENLADVRSRAMTWLEKILRAHLGERVAVVAHGGVNRVLLATLLSMPLSAIFSLDQEFCCTNIVDFFHDGPVLVRAVNLRVEAARDAISFY